MSAFNFDIGRPDALRHFGGPLRAEPTNRGGLFLVGSTHPNTKAAQRR